MNVFVFVQKISATDLTHLLKSCHLERRCDRYVSWQSSNKATLEIIIHLALPAPELDRLPVEYCFLPSQIILSDSRAPGRHSFDELGQFRHIELALASTDHEKLHQSLVLETARMCSLQLAIFFSLLDLFKKLFLEVLPSCAEYIGTKKSELRPHIERLLVHGCAGEDQFSDRAVTQLGDVARPCGGSLLDALRFIEYDARVPVAAKFSDELCAALSCELVDVKQQYLWSRVFQEQDHLFEYCE